MAPRLPTWRDDKYGERNSRILERAGRMKLADIAAELDVSIGIVSGVIRRARQRRNSRRKRPAEVVKTIRLPLDLAEQIELYASYRNTSLSAFLREAARRQLTNCQRPEGG